MSLATWKEEFYPVDADRVSEADAVQHSLTKWIGLRAENLARHAVTMNQRYLADGSDDTLRIDGSTCALCEHYESESSCSSCPLAQVRDGVRCDVEIEGFDDSRDEQYSPWHQWDYNRDPEPMIHWLQKAKAKEAA
jgi:hypothetical protein